MCFLKIFLSFLYSCKERNQRKHAPGKAFILVRFGFFGNCRDRIFIAQWNNRHKPPLHNALRGDDRERPETQPDALRHLRFSERANRAGESIVSGGTALSFSIVSLSLAKKIWSCQVTRNTIKKFKKTV